MSSDYTDLVLTEQGLHGLPELVVFRHVDEWIYTAIQEHHDDGKIVIYTREVDQRRSNIEHKEICLIPNPTEHEAACDDGQCL